MTLEQRVQALLASRPVLGALRRPPLASLARRASGSRMRILGYHGVKDADRFDAHMRAVVAGGTPVTAAQVVAAIRNGEPLPERPVWITFDDGDPSVVENGLPVLERHGITATMFICPGLIESGEPFWWNLSEWAEPGGELTGRLKTVPDAERRQEVADLAARHGQPFPHEWRQLSDDDLRRWTDAGMELGNHSWDHPCLEHVSEDEQRAQVRQTHAWLTEHLGEAPTLFAYPNGVFCEAVDEALHELEYDAAVLYDHRMSPVATDPLQISRLLVDDIDPPERIAAIMSGGEPLVWGLASRVLNRL